jgi:hypothetical protein
MEGRRVREGMNGLEKRGESVRMDLWGENKGLNRGGSEGPRNCTVSQLAPWSHWIAYILL